MRLTSRVTSLLGLPVVLFCVSCTTPAPPAEASKASDTEQSPTQTPYKRLELKYQRPIVGAEVAVSGSGLPAGEMAELKWGTVTGGWVVEDYYHFRGKKY